MQHGMARRGTDRGRRATTVAAVVLALIVGAATPATSTPGVAVAATADGWIELDLLGGQHADVAAVADTPDGGAVAVGSLGDGDEAHVARWDVVTGTGTDLGTLPGGTLARAVDVSRHGDLVGTAFDAADQERAVFAAGGATALTDLGTLPGWSYSQGVGVDDAGRVVGHSCDLCGLEGPSLDQQPWRWTPAEGLVPLALGGGDAAVVRQVTGSGLAAGFVAFLGEDRWEAAVWDLATTDVTLFGELGGEPSRGSAVADDGTVVGATTADRPFLAGPGQPMRGLATPALPGGDAMAIGDELVVGDLRPPSGNGTPARWWRGSLDDPQLLDLPPGTTFGSARYVADGGLVVGQADGLLVAWRRGAGFQAATQVPPPGRVQALARDLSDSGVLVGTYRTEPAPGGQRLAWAHRVTTQPDPPTGVASPLSDAGLVVVRWAPPADDGGSPITGYRVTRDGVLVAELGADARSWADADWRTSADPLLIDHRYEVRAVNDLGSSLAAGTRFLLDILPPPPPPDPVVAEPRFTG